MCKKMSKTMRKRMARAEARSSDDDFPDTETKKSPVDAAAAADGKETETSEAAARPVLCILVGSEYGTGKRYAKQLAHEAEAQGWATEMHDAATFDRRRLAAEPTAQRVFAIIASTHGQGDPAPSMAKLHDWLLDDAAVARAGMDLLHTRYAVFALGDERFKHYCRAGLVLAERLAALGAKPVAGPFCGNAAQPRARDAAFDDFAAALWRTEGAAAPVATGAVAPVLEYTLHHHPAGRGKKRKHSAAPTPFPLPLPGRAPSAAAPCWADVTKREVLTDGDRSTLLLEVDGVPEYEAGDHMGVLPSNPPAVVDAYLASLCAPPGRSLDDVFSLVPAAKKHRGPKVGALPQPAAARTALTWYYDLTGAPPTAVLRQFSTFTRDPEEQAAFRALLDGAVDEAELPQTVLGYLQRFPSTKVPLGAFLELMPRSQPRWYSVASDSATHGSRAALCVSLVAGGVCSTFLAALEEGDALPCFIRRSSFRLPRDKKTRPILAVGAGVGVAPFIGYLHRRQAWADAGHRLGACDFYLGCRTAASLPFRPFLEAAEAEGGAGAPRLRVALSRAGGPKEYVQDALEKDAPGVWAALAKGAAVYVCGDADGMARGVDAALRRICSAEGGLSADDAEAYVAKLEADGRYMKDVWSVGLPTPAQGAAAHTPARRG
eukprot:TRINITY_DN29662_c0_g1_i1.p1 TRINITY_DN29662_c0_g1~~TRINITY_DN29662_c0_g1_i1.p1  ORF type:complete len:661 (+),score=177.43 TRINITY_DN29662_c0_g1_i1:69-2051(+)